MNQKKKYILLFVIILTGLLLLVIFNEDQSNEDTAPLFNPQDSAIVAINKVKVYKQEYLLHLKKEVAMTYNHFFLEYGANNHPEFWTTTYGNTTPIDYLKNRTDKSVLSSKITHALAVENNVIARFDFNEFIQQWKDYNIDRQQKSAEGQVVFGQVYNSMSDYYFYLLSNLEIRVAAKIKKKNFSPNNSELQNFYEARKQDKFSYAKSIEIEKFGFPYDSFSYKEAVNILEELAKINIGAESLCCDFKKEYQKSVYQKHVFYDSIPIYGEDNPDKILKSTASELAFGETKTVRTEEGVYIIRLLKPLEISYYSYEKIQGQVLEYYQQEKYNDFISQLKNEALITKNDKIYDQFSNKDFK